MTSWPLHRRLTAATAATAVALLAGCGLEPTPMGRAQQDQSSPTAAAADRPALGALVPALTVDRAASALDGLPAVAAPGPAYNRDDYGRAWADVDHNGCGQRDDVLLRDARPGTAVTARQRLCRHDVLAGTWTDPYSGRALTATDLQDPAQSRAVTVDHVVPLAEAHRSGARSWPARRRAAFANDLGNLVVAGARENTGKGDQDPARWRPPRRSAWCAYGLAWIEVKDRWRLASDDDERAALGAMLRTCAYPRAGLLGRVRSSSTRQASTARLNQVLPGDQSLRAGARCPDVAEAATSLTPPGRARDARHTSTHQLTWPHQPDP